MSDDGLYRIAVEIIIEDRRRSGTTYQPRPRAARRPHQGKQMKNPSISCTVPTNRRES